MRRFQGASPGRSCRQGWWGASAPHPIDDPVVQSRPTRCLTSVRLRPSGDEMDFGAAMSVTFVRPAGWVRRLMALVAAAAMAGAARVVHADDSSEADRAR